MSEIAQPLDDGMVSIYPVLRWFHYQHLPMPLQEVSKPFCDLALQMAGVAPQGDPEMAAALRKLLETKDCAVRVVVGQRQGVSNRG